MPTTGEIIRKGLKEISDNELYTPEQIVEKGLIMNTIGQPSRFFLYRLIKSGKVPFKDLGVSKPRYVINGRDLKKFVKERYGF